MKIYRVHCDDRSQFGRYLWIVAKDLAHAAAKAEIVIDHIVACSIDSITLMGDVHIDQQ